MLTLKTSDFRLAFKNQVNFDHRHNRQIKFFRRLKSSHIRTFDPPDWNQLNLDHPHKKQFVFHVHPKNKRFSASIQVTTHFLQPSQQPNQFHPYTEINSSSILHTDTKSIATITKTKIVSMLTLKQVIFYTHTKTRSNSTPAKKLVNFGPHTKTKSIFTPTPNQVNFDPSTEVESISIPTIK